MNIVLIGSTSFPVVESAIAIAEYVRGLPAGTVIRTRGAKGFDVFAAEVARIMGFEVQVFPGKGGAFNFERDQAIVDGAERVIAFFDPEHIGEGGTQHVIEKALDQGVPTEAYTVHDKQLVLVGSSDDGESANRRIAANARGETAAIGQGPA